MAVGTRVMAVDVVMVPNVVLFSMKKNFKLKSDEIILLKLSRGVLTSETHGLGGRPGHHHTPTARSQASKLSMRDFNFR